MVSKARLDLPDPDRPVMTVRLSRGISTSIPLRLCSRAPRTEMWVSMDAVRSVYVLVYARASGRSTRAAAYGVCIGAFKPADRRPPPHNAGRAATNGFRTG